MYCPTPQFCVCVPTLLFDWQSTVSFFFADDYIKISELNIMGFEVAARVAVRAFQNLEKEITLQAMYQQQI